MLMLSRKVGTATASVLSTPKRMMKKNLENIFIFKFEQIYITTISKIFLKKCVFCHQCHFGN